MAAAQTHPESINTLPTPYGVLCTCIAEEKPGEKDVLAFDRESLA